MWQLLEFAIFIYVPVRQSSLKFIVFFDEILGKVNSAVRKIINQRDNYSVSQLKKFVKFFILSQLSAQYFSMWKFTLKTLWPFSTNFVHFLADHVSVFILQEFRKTKWNYQIIFKTSKFHKLCEDFERSKEEDNSMTIWHTVCPL